jgi:ribonuclease BN (tRNA processing enzyme)
MDHMSSRLVVLGSCGAWPEPGRACSGFVLEHDGFRLVIDLGYGTLSPLLAIVDSVHGTGIDAVVITHKHPDHMLDLHGLFRARWFGVRGEKPIPLYAPDGVVHRLQGLEEDDHAAILEVFAWQPLPGTPYEVGPFRLESWSLPHFVPNAGVRLTCDSFVLAYTGDTGPDPALLELAQDADLFVAEASDRSQRPGAPAPAGRRMHLSARDAGEVAQAAHSRRLLLTHFWPGNDRDKSRAEAEQVYDGEVLLAEEGLEVALDAPA